MFLSLLLSTRTVGVTVDTLGTANWQPSYRNPWQKQRGLNSDTISIMRPPPFPAHELGLRANPQSPKPSLTSHNRHPVNQRPSVLPIASSPQFSSYHGDVRTVHSNLAQLHQGFSNQNISPENDRQQIASHIQTGDSTSRKPLQFSYPSDNSMSESIADKQVIAFPDRHQLHFPSLILQQGHKQLTGLNVVNPLKLHQNRFVQNALQSGNVWNQNGIKYANRPSFEDNLGNQKHTAVSQSPQTSVTQASPSTEIKRFPNVSNYRSLEPNVQFAQSIEASEHHSTYHAPAGVLHSSQLPSAIRITKPPDFGPATRSFLGNDVGTTSAPDIRKKVTLKDVLVEDCPKAKAMGYCASPRRYPT